MPVLEAQRRYRDRMEAEPISFFVEDSDGLLDAARASLAAFLRCQVNDLVYVPNATYAVATVLTCVEGVLEPGDRLLTNSHEYPACQNNLRRTAQRTGAIIDSAELPFPVRDPGEITQRILDQVKPRTKLALLSAVTSPTGLALPIRDLVPELERRGVMVMLDAAHAPGMLTEFNLDGIGASFATANNHKWLCTPKGSAFLHVRADRQKHIRPLILSNFAERGKPNRPQFVTDFDFIGTADYTAYFATKDAIEFMPRIVSGGWPEVMHRNHELVIRGRDILCRALNVEPPAPDSMIGCISSILLPKHEPERAVRLAARPSKYHDALQNILLREHKIQVPLWSVPGTAPGATRLIRISAQVYNSVAQYEYLAECLKRELERERGM